MAYDKEKIDRLVDDVIAGAGGLSNIHAVNHCMTRLRLVLANAALADVEALKAAEGVLGVVVGNPLQVVIGPGKVNIVADELKTRQAEAVEKEAAVASDDKGARVSMMDRFRRSLAALSGIFVPLIPAFVGAGLVGGLGSVLGNCLTAGTLTGEPWITLVTLSGVIQKALYAYLQIFVGINAARQWGGTEPLGGVVGGMIYLAGVTADTPIANIFVGGTLSAGQGGIIGVLLAVWLMCKLDVWLKRVIPDAVDIILRPFIVLVVIGAVTIYLIMPFAGAVSDWLVGGIVMIIDVGGEVAGFILAATFLPMVMFGLHQILVPIHLQMIQTTGSTLLLPILAMAGAGQIGAALALLIRCRCNKPLINLIKGALPVGFLGIGEPLIYTVTLPLGRPFVTACIGGGIGGAVVGYFGNVGAIAIGPSGLALIPLIADNLWWAYCLGLLAGYAGGFILTFFFGVPKDAMVSVEIAKV